MKLADDLRQLHQLLEDGILTQAEFDAQKQALLAQAQGTAPAVDTDTVEQSVADADAGSAISLAPKDAALTATAASFSRPAPTAKNTNQLPWPLIVGGIAVVALLSVAVWMGSSASGEAQGATLALPASSMMVGAADLTEVAPAAAEAISEFVAASGRAGAEELLVMEKLKLGSVRSVACALTEQGEPACRITADFSELESLMKLADDTGDAHSLVDGRDTWVFPTVDRREARAEARAEAVVVTKGGSTATKKFDPHAEDHDPHAEEHMPPPVEEPPKQKPSASDMVITRLDEETIVVGYRGGVDAILATQAGTAASVETDKVYASLLKHIDSNGMLLVAMHELRTNGASRMRESTKEILSNVRGAMSISVSSKVEIKAAVFPLNDEIKSQLELGKAALGMVKMQARKYLAQAQAEMSKLSQADGTEAGKQYVGSIVGTLLTGILGGGNYEFIEALIESAAFEDIDGGLVFTASAPVPEGGVSGLVKGAIGGFFTFFMM